jgi:hypothetical protein
MNKPVLTQGERESIRAAEGVLVTLLWLGLVGVAIAGFVLGLVGVTRRIGGAALGDSATTFGANEGARTGSALTEEAAAKSEVATESGETHTIILQPGTYTGDVLLPPGVQLRGSDPTQPELVRIMGTLRYENTTAGALPSAVAHLTLVAPTHDAPALHFTGVYAQDLVVQNVTLTHAEHEQARTVSLMRMWNSAGAPGTGTLPTVTFEDKVLFKPLTTSEGSDILHRERNVAEVVPYGLDALYGSVFVNGNVQFLGGLDKVAMRVANSTHVNTQAHSLSGLSISGQVVLDKSRDLIGVTHGTAPFHFVTYNMYCAISAPNDFRHGCLMVAGSDSVRDVVRFHNATFVNTQADATFDPDPVEGPFVVSTHTWNLGKLDVVFSSSTALSGTDAGDEFAGMTPGALIASSSTDNRIFVRSATHG